MIINVQGIKLMKMPFIYASYSQQPQTEIYIDDFFDMNIVSKDKI